MTAADITAWITPAVILALFAWLRLDLGRLINRVDTSLGSRIDLVNENLGKRIDLVNENLGKRIDEVNSRMSRMEQSMQGLDDRLRTVEVTLGTAYGKLDILERYIMRRNELSDEPPPAAAE